jgi:hypothetical protein
MLMLMIYDHNFLANVILRLVFSRWLHNVVQSGFGCRGDRRNREQNIVKLLGPSAAVLSD